MHKLINRYDISIKVEDKTVPAVELTAQNDTKSEKKANSKADASAESEQK